MLEAIRERSQSWIAKLILILITVPFAIFGVDSYLRDAGSKAAVAEINNEPITIQEFGKSLQETRANLEGKADANFMNDPQVRTAVLDKLINMRLLRAEIKRGGYTVTDEQLSKLIVTMPEFQKKGQFSQETYDKLLAANGLTPNNFEARMRDDLLVQQVREGIAGMAFAPEAVTNTALRARHQLREVSVATILAEDLFDAEMADATAVQAYYDKNKSEFGIPEQVQLEFVALSTANLMSNIQITDDEIRKFYQENVSRFQGDEERHASHILIIFGGKTDAVAKAAAKKKALEVLSEVKKSPEKFDVLAKKYSQDPGSAENGGDLGAVKRGVMVKPFEEAVFGMAPGSVSDLVETDFGYHIIKLTEVKGSAPTLEEAKNQIRGELLNQKASASFAEAAEVFSNTVYEQSTSLAPAAQAHHLEIQKSSWMSREDVIKFFKNNEKIANAIFSDAVRKEKRNTEAVEIAPNTLVAARVVDSRAPSIKLFAEVKVDIEKKLRQLQAAKKAAQQGDLALQSLKQGKEVGTLTWSSPVQVSRNDAQGLTDSVVAKAFQMIADKLPAYAGAISKNGSYVLIRVTAIEDGLLKLDNNVKDKSLAEYNTLLSAEYLAAYLKSLKTAAKITIHRDLLLSNNQIN